MIHVSRVAFLEQIRERISDGKKFQQWAFRVLQEKTEYKATMACIMVEKVEPSVTSQQCSRCGCTLDENHDGQQFACLNCGYTANTDYNAAKNIAKS